MPNLSAHFLQAYQHQFVGYSLFCKRSEDKSQLIKDKRKHHGAVDICSLEQQLCKPDMITFVV